MKKKMTNWRIHEERCKKSKYYQDYNMKWQKHSKSTGKRPDGFGINKTNPKIRVVSESKYCKEAKMEHINQIQKYKQHPFYAKTGIIHYPKNANISQEFRKCAKEKNVIITRTMMEKNKEPTGFLGVFIEPKYKK